MPKLTNGENSAHFFPSFKNPDFLFKLFDFMDTPPIDYQTYRFFLILQSFRTDVIRCSTWLLVLMAFIRYLALKVTANTRYKEVSKFPFGFYAALVCLAISTVMSTLSFFRTKMIENGIWIPDEKCGIKSDEVRYFYVLGPTEFETYLNGYLLRVFNFVNGFLSDILPCVVLPVATIILTMEVKNARKNLLNSVSVRKSTERTTLLIILMTASFFIASLPAGVFTFLQVLYTDVGFLHLSTFVDHYCNAILTINASTHCIECLIMSSEYRRTVKDVLRINKQNVVRISSVVF
ncbi:hypothetical protein CAEBREN_32698 [Caenorhabditis brenneri]|uniref:G-protein coupled receptors family 1 profile domain-containing protein n=1 Tax=Caenorhabditis brenneri TaxID=135651 RepID=G0P0I7_CAEBE|nr:hypothetical protein CAEBREN_32698 [Caenorhabditis brenneri]